MTASKTTKGTTKTSIKTEKNEKTTYRVYHIDPGLWESIKTNAHKAEKSATDYINAAVGDNLDTLVADLLTFGIYKAEAKRVRMKKPASWDLLIGASQKTGLPAIQLLALCAHRQIQAITWNDKATKQTGTRGTILNLPIEDQLIEEPKAKKSRKGKKPLDPSPSVIVEARP
jgi:hypothetical protein